MEYAFCGRCGLLLPKISLGLWHNFGDVDIFDNAKAMVLRAFDKGITHFDLANNYGPPPAALRKISEKYSSKALARIAMK